MGDAIGMEILQYIDNLGDIEDLDLISQFIDIKFDEIDKLPTLTELLNEVEVGLILKGIFQCDYSRVFTIRQQLLLHHCLILFLLPL